MFIFYLVKWTILERSFTRGSLAAKAILNAHKARKELFHY